MTESDAYQQSLFGDDALKIIPLGGLGEIGMNTMVLECQGRIMIIDAGVMFPNEEMLGVDLVLPDVSYLVENKDRIEGIVITHGHEDHIGGLPFLLPELDDPPIYGSPFALALIQARLKEYNLKADLNPVEPNMVVELGPFTVGFIRVTHSIPDCFGLKIDTPRGLVVHSGDFKVDHGMPPGEATDLGAFAACAKDKPLLLMADSTNVERAGYTINEQTVFEALDDIFREVRGKILAACFASAVRRIQQIIDLAERYDRVVAVSGRSMINNITIAQELGMLRFPAHLQVNLGDIKNIPPEQVCVLTTGSQGEPRSALARIAAGEHKQVIIDEGDVVLLSSRFIPGHELAITRLINRLCGQGAEVIYDKIAPIHSSGHAQQEELKLLMSLVRPNHFLPVHGELRHLIRHARLARELGLPKNRCLTMTNGEVGLFDRDGFRLGEPIESGRVYVDGKGVGDVGEVVIRDRRQLSADGVVLVFLVVDRRTGKIISGPEVVSRGFVFEEENGDLLSQAKEAIEEVMEEHPGPDWDLAQEEIRRALKRMFNRRLDRRPVILPMITPM